MKPFWEESSKTKMYSKIYLNSEFKIGACNSTESIENLKEIGGKSISELEQSMRPGEKSFNGFLGPGSTRKDFNRLFKIALKKIKLSKNIHTENLFQKKKYLIKDLALENFTDYLKNNLLDSLYKLEKNEETNSEEIDLFSDNQRKSLVKERWEEIIKIFYTTKEYWMDDIKKSNLKLKEYSAVVVTIFEEEDLDKKIIYYRCPLKTMNKIGKDEVWVVIPQDILKEILLEFIEDATLEIINSLLPPEGKIETLLEVLKTDNNTVLKAGLTHQSIAGFLNKIIAIYTKTENENEREPTIFCSNDEFYTNSTLYQNRYVRDEEKSVHIICNGQEYFIRRNDYLGNQSSPFDEKTSSSKEYFIENIDTKEVIFFSGIHPHLIGKYGFYEGFGTPYRLPPEKLIKFFALLPHFCFVNEKSKENEEDKNNNIELDISIEVKQKKICTIQ